MNALIILGGLKVYGKLAHRRCNSKVNLIGKTALVTGANSGIGYQIALNLASRGARLILADIHDPVNSHTGIAQETDNHNIVSYKFDLSRLDSVREFAAKIHTKEKRLDILVHNAGTAGNREAYTEDGLLRTTSVNHFGPFLLTHLLADLLKRTPTSRVCFISSLTAFCHRLYNPYLINQPPKYRNKALHIFTEYSNSKFSQIACANCFAEKLERHGVFVNSCHPGLIDSGRSPNYGESVQLTTRIVGSLFPGLFFFYGKTPRDGSQTPLHCVLDHDYERCNGKFFVNCRVFVQPPMAQITGYRWTLFRETERLVKLQPNEQI